MHYDYVPLQRITFRGAECDNISYAKLGGVCRVSPRELRTQSQPPTWPTTGLGPDMLGEPAEPATEHEQFAFRALARIGY